MNYRLKISSTFDPDAHSLRPGCFPRISPPRAVFFWGIPYSFSQMLRVRFAPVFKDLLYWLGPPRAGFFLRRATARLDSRWDKKARLRLAGQAGHNYHQRRMEENAGERLTCCDTACCKPPSSTLSSVKHLFHAPAVTIVILARGHPDW
jgi:hypothetical protein